MIGDGLMSIGIPPCQLGSATVTDNESDRSGGTLS
jgi:hypothetical protein